MLIKIYPENPNPRDVKQVVECLQDGGIIIYPTDTIYGIGCDIFKPKSIERIVEIIGDKKKINPLFYLLRLEPPFRLCKTNTESYFKAMKKTLPVVYLYFRSQ